MSTAPDAMGATDGGTGGASVAPGSWVVTLCRAIPALVLGLVITFTPDHSAVLGLIGFGVYALITGAVLLAAAWRRLIDTSARAPFLIQGVVTVVAGIAALILPSGGTPYLVWILSAWAVVAGALELVTGVRHRRRNSAARDWILTGALTVLLAIAVLLVPPGLATSFTGPDGVQRVLTDAIVVVGILGAWAVIVGVQLGIAAVSLRAERGDRSGASAS
jgi:uncharacterized membrane protein HdeD (DUF308 family)